MKARFNVKSCAATLLCTAALSVSVLLLGCAGQPQKVPKEPIVGQLAPAAIPVVSSTA